MEISVVGDRRWSRCSCRCLLGLSCSIKKGEDLSRRGVEVGGGHRACFVFARLVVYGELTSRVFIAWLNGFGKGEVLEVDGARVPWAEGFVPVGYVPLALGAGR